ncbi:MAG: response regulator [Bacteroidetes bacterium]|nr:response regulator [Bacteroidota bacterium]
MDAANILIVEDDQIFADLVQFQLSTIGYQLEDIISVPSLKEAEEVKQELEPDVILLDLNILDSNGVKTYDSINELFPNTSIVVLSGMDDQSIALEIVSKGGQDYLLKSGVNPQILEKAIKYGLLRRSFRSQLANSEKRYKDLFNKSPMPMVQLTGEYLIITMVNNALVELYGFSSQDIIGKSIYSFNKNPENRFKDETTRRFTHVDSKGEEIVVDVILNRLNDENNEFIALIVNKTEELQFEKNKFDIINQAEESEKKKIARELHDGLGQQLVLLNLLFQNVNPPEEQVSQFKDISGLIQNTIREVKEIAYNLLPPELDKGFINGIDRFANRINTLGQMVFDLEISPDLSEADLGEVDRFNLYRIVQEVINNAIKHAKASKIVFRLKREDKGMFIEIEDNGVGFDQEKVKFGLGLQNIQYRMKMSKIKGDVVSEIGKGTKIILWF